MTALDVRIESKQFAANPVLGSIAFRLEAGTRVAILGESGIGKSTLLALLVGYDTNYEGRIMRPAGQAAMVFQTPRLLPWRTLAENIALIPGTGPRDRARQLLTEVGLGEAADQYPQMVSLGMQRRVSIVRALAVNPSLILLDEPLVSLDSATAVTVRDLLLRVMDQTGAICVMATHDRREALTIADRIIEIGGRPAQLTSDRSSPLDRSERLNPSAVDQVYRQWFESGHNQTGHRDR